MRMHNWFQGIALFLFTTAVSMFSTEAQLSTEDIAKIRQELAHNADEPGPNFSERTAEDFVSSYGPDAVPVLVGMLEDESVSVPNKGRVAFYLGKFGDASVVPVIWSLITQTAKGSIGKDEQFLLYFAMLGLAYTDSSGALEHLRELADADYWKDRTIAPYGPAGGSYSTRIQFVENLRKAALGALGDAGTTAAKEILLQLRSDRAQDLEDRIAEALKECERRVKGEPYSGDEVPLL